MNKLVRIATAVAEGARLDRRKLVGVVLGQLQLGVNAATESIARLAGVPFVPVTHRKYLIPGLFLTQGPHRTPRRLPDPTGDQATDSRDPHDAGRRRSFQPRDLEPRRPVEGLWWRRPPVGAGCVRDYSMGLGASSIASQIYMIAQCSGREDLTFMASSCILSALSIWTWYLSEVEIFILSFRSEFCRLSDRIPRRHRLVDRALERCFHDGTSTTLRREVKSLNLKEYLVSGYDTRLARSVTSSPVFAPWQKDWRRRRGDWISSLNPPISFHTQVIPIF